jgi:hypothetical protein
MYLKSALGQQKFRVVIPLIFLSIVVLILFIAIFYHFLLFYFIFQSSPLLVSYTRFCPNYFDCYLFYFLLLLILAL